ncbi:MAG: ankyrin repeat domain-containing protein, partial [Armatimonadota bacterium]
LGVLGMLVVVPSAAWLTRGFWQRELALARMREMSKQHEKEHQEAIALEMIYKNDMPTKDAVNAPDSHGLTPLMEAVRYDNLAKAKKVIELGANVDAVGKGNTALTLAAGYGRLEIIKLLLEHKASLRAVPGALPGRTPLSEAVRMSKPVA